LSPEKARKLSPYIKFWIRTLKEVLEVNGKLCNFSCSTVKIFMTSSCFLES
jgi:hypothetical protein